MGDPHRCPVCDRVFNWGKDADSAIVEQQGEAWLQCRENAYWKLQFHFAAEHPAEGFICPRRGEVASTFHNSRSRDFWGSHNGHKSCSYCGSISPAEFFEAVEAGREITPTDKNYKAYVELPNPAAGQVVQYGSESGPAYDFDGKPTRDDLTEAEKLAGRFNRPLMGTAGPTVNAKFYFQHLSEDEKRRFVDLLNAGKFKLSYPGRFYAPPFFVRFETPAAK